jgi:alpha-beta hydrolase superfamily lysophospholipase
MQMGELRAEDGGDAIDLDVFSPDESRITGAVLIIPGFAEPGMIYADLAKHLSDAGYRCLVLEHPDDPDAGGPFYQRSLRNIRLAFQEATRAAEGRRLAVYSHSMGANITIHHLLDAEVPGLACALFESPWIALRRPIGARDALALRLLARMFPTSAVRLPFDGSRPVWVRKGSYRHTEHFDEIRTRLLSDMHDGSLYAREHASRMRLPCFFAVGDGENIVSTKATEAFCESCGGPTELHRYAAGHSIHTDTVRRDLFADAVAFLNRHMLDSGPFEPAS